VLLVDLNKDGKIDIGASNFELAPQPSVSILLGNGDGTFGPNTEFPMVSTPFVVIADDFNSDGKSDLAVNARPVQSRRLDQPCWETATEAFNRRRTLRLALLNPQVSRRVTLTATAT